MRRRDEGLTEEGRREQRHYDRTSMVSHFAIALAHHNWPSTFTEADGIMNRATMLADAYLRKRDELDKEVFDE